MICSLYCTYIFSILFSTLSAAAHTRQVSPSYKRCLFDSILFRIRALACECVCVCMDYGPCCNALHNHHRIGFSFCLNFYRCQCFIVLISFGFLFNTNLLFQMEFIAFCSLRVKSHKNFFNNLLKNDIPAALEHNDDSTFLLDCFHSLLFGFSNAHTEARKKNLRRTAKLLHFEKRYGKKGTEDLLVSVLLSPNRFHFLLSF